MSKLIDDYLKTNRPTECPPALARGSETTIAVKRDIRQKRAAFRRQHKSRNKQ